MSRPALPPSSTPSSVPAWIIPQKPPYDLNLICICNPLKIPVSRWQRNTGSRTEHWILFQVTSTSGKISIWSLWLCIVCDCLRQCLTEANSRRITGFHVVLIAWTSVKPSARLLSHMFVSHCWSGSSIQNERKVTSVLYCVWRISCERVKGILFLKHR